MVPLLYTQPDRKDILSFVHVVCMLCVVCVYACKCTCVMHMCRGQRTALPPILFKVGCLFAVPNTRLAGLQDSVSLPHLALEAVGLQTHLCGCQGSQLRSSHLQSKRFTH